MVWWEPELRKLQKHIFVPFTSQILGWEVNCYLRGLHDTAPLLPTFFIQNVAFLYANPKFERGVPVRESGSASDPLS